MIAQSGIQALNPIDCVMRCADVAIRQQGYPGIETQTLVWLDGRADGALLRTAIARLSRHYPVIASRLIEPGGAGDRAHWQLRSGEVCPLWESDLSSDDPDAVLERAGEVLSNGRDPSDADPLEFHLLHRPGGKDVLLLQYSHVLMDNTVTLPLLRKIDRLARTDEPPVPFDQKRPIFEHLHQFPRDSRRQAVQAAIELQTRTLRGRAATLLPAGPAPPGRALFRIATRALGLVETATFRSRIVALCGFPCISMAILGSAFRAVHDLGPTVDQRHDYVAGIGIPLGHPPRDSLVFQNLTSAVPIYVRHQDIDERDRVVRLLSDQLRQQLTAGVDLGTLATTAIFSRRLRYIEWVVWHLIRYGYSLWYAFFGNLDAAGDQFCGTKVEKLFYAGGPVWPSIGLTLLVNQFHGRLHFQATFDPRLVPPEMAEAFLEFLLADLT